MYCIYLLFINVIGKRLQSPNSRQYHAGKLAKFLSIYLSCIVQADTIKPRSVNLALDTVLEFNNKDNKDLDLIDNVQGFLDKIKNVLKDKSGRRSMDEDFKFTDFLTKFFEVIRNYEDDDLEDVVAVIDDEIRKYHYVGCKFYEILQNYEMRRFVGHKLDQIKDKTSDEIRLDLDNIIDVLKTQMDGDVRQFFEYINSLYPKNSKVKLKKFLNNMGLYKSKSKRANLDLIKIVREGVRNIVFDHYTNLNVNARKDFKLRLETFWKNFVDPHKVEHKVWNLKYTKDETNARGKTDSPSSPVNREFNEDPTPPATTRKETDNLKVSKSRDDLSTGKNNLTSKSIDFNFLRDKFAEKNIIVTTEGNWNFSAKGIVTNIKYSKKPINIKIDEKNIFGSFEDDVTNRNIVKEFEKSIDLHIPDISEMMKQKFNAITKEKLLETKNVLMKDIHVDIDKNYWTTKKDIEIKRQKTKHKERKHKTPKRFSIVTTEKHTQKEKISDSEELNDSYDKTTTERHTTRKRKSKTTTKRKHKKDTKSPSRSRFMTLYTEDYTKKVKKTRIKEKTTKKHRSHKSRKEKKLDRNKYKIEKTKKSRDITIGDYEEITERTTKAKKYKERHDKKTKHKKHKSEKKRRERSGTTKKSRKWLKLSAAESSEGMSIESFETQRSFRKNIDFDHFTQNNASSMKINETRFKTTYNSTRLTPRTTATQTAELSTSAELTIPTFGRLEFWPGTTKFPTPVSSAETTILPNATNVIVETTTFSTTGMNDSSNIVLRSVEYNNTFQSKEERLNDTMRFIDVEFEDAVSEYSTKLPNTTKVDRKNSESLALKKSTIKLTTKQQKPKATTVKSKTKRPALKRRNIGVATVKNKITTTKHKAASQTNATVFNMTTPIFNVAEFLNKSEIFSEEDTRRKNLLRDRIMKDMQAVFSPTTTSKPETTRDEFPDPFNDIENALGIE